MGVTVEDDTFASDTHNYFEAVCSLFVAFNSNLFSQSLQISLQIRFQSLLILICYLPNFCAVVEMGTSKSRHEAKFFF